MAGMEVRERKQKRTGAMQPSHGATESAARAVAESRAEEEAGLRAQTPGLRA